jgi:hypothetical protein
MAPPEVAAPVEEAPVEQGADPEQVIQEILDKVTALEAKIDQILAAMPMMQKGGRTTRRRR